MQPQMVTAFNVRLRQTAYAALGAALALTAVCMPAVQAFAQGAAPSAKPAQTAIPQPAAPQAVPGFWDPRRRPDRPDLSRITVIRFLTETDYPPFNFTGPDGNPVPGIAPAAKQQGRYVAATIRARLAGKTMPPFRYAHAGSLAQIGKRLAVIDFGRIKLRGTLAWWIWGIAHIYFLIGLRHRLSVALSWLWIYMRDHRAARERRGAPVRCGQPGPAPSEAAGGRRGHRAVRLSRCRDGGAVRDRPDPEPTRRGRGDRGARWRLR